jgi:tetratricopeptide (TPR) repeat protein
VSARTRIALLVALIAAAAVAVAVGVAALSGGSDEPAAQAPHPRAGHPPLSLQLGVRTDREAVDLRRALGLYQQDRYAAAGRVFRRHDSLESRVGSLFVAWPGVSLDRLERLAALHPASGVVQLNLGLARLWAARGDPAAPWRQVLERAPDTPYAVTAADLLHPEYARGQPVFVPSEPAPDSIVRLAPPQQFEVLRQRADRSVRDRLLYGVALQRLGRLRSAEREYAAAAAEAPNDPEALTAAAVGRFTKDQPVRAFSRLGPLTKRFPHSATVRFHLGLLLLWTGQLAEAKRQLRLATSVEPGSRAAREAERFLKRLA